MPFSLSYKHLQQFINTNPLKRKKVQQYQKNEPFLLKIKVINIEFLSNFKEIPSNKL